jgi:hypothetical protein
MLVGPFLPFPVPDDALLVFHEFEYPERITGPPIAFITKEGIGVGKRC